MRFIKKLVILTGSGARGTLMLEKNSYGVWGRLSLFDFALPSECKLAVISGNEMFVMKLGSDSLGTTFKLGELDFESVHAAVISDKVALYGSNCAKKLDPCIILQRVIGQERLMRSEEERYVRFSGLNCDYFKEIAPPRYNDAAIADKNYFPAYYSIIPNPIEEPGETPENPPEQNDVPFTALSPDLPLQSEQSPEQKEEPLEQNETSPKHTEVPLTQPEVRLAHTDAPPRQEAPSSRTDASPEQAGTSPDQVETSPRQSKKTDKDKEDDMKSTKPLPHELEQRYLRLIEAAACKAQPDISEEEPQSVAGQKEPTPQRKGLPAESPEVIAMARRVTLRDYRVTQTGKSAPKARKATFFERSSGRLNKLLASHERYEPIERLIPGSKFVKINYDGQRYYLVGAIGSDYICYGVPGMYSDEPPEPLTGYARWLPCDASKPHGDGFWMMYQDGVSGETLKN